MANRSFSPALHFCVLVLTLFFMLSQASAQPVSRIVGGNNADPGEYPFMVALLSAGSGTPSFRQFCGGSLIHPKWVLTAAHCVDSTAASDIEIGVGKHNLSTFDGEEIAVSQIIVHPDYNDATNDNDIALIELSTNATQGTPITLFDGSSSLTGVTSTAIGWGATSEGGNGAAILQEVDLPVVSQSSCNAAYGGGITANMVCAGFDAGGKDSCQGDSGGPLIIGGSASPQLVGATSFGVGCARPGFYGVYARVSEYRTWIANYITFASGTDGPYGLWSGFIDLVNIAELRNDSASPVTAQINLFSISGNLISSTMVGVAANAKQDVIINQLPGFTLNSYGLIQVSSNVSGRIFYYRPLGTGFSNFEFAFGIPLTEPVTGTHYVGFNTFQPSSNPFDQSNLVANWLSVVNLEESARNFVVNKYDSNGGLIHAQGFSLEAKQRIDLDGGHSNPGPNQVGLLEIIPQDGSSEFLAQLIRYGYAQNPTSFDFAFPLIPFPGSSGTISVPIGSRFTAQNWLEVLNVSSSTQNVNVEVYNETGALLQTQGITLAPRSQQHLNLTSILGEGNIGQAILNTSAIAVSQAMFYFRNPSTGSITAMYGSQAASPSALDVRGAFNLFLSMENYLKVSNTSASAISVDFTVFSAFSAGGSSMRSIPAKASIELSIHDFATFGTAPDSYGTILVAPNGATVQTEILRTKRDGFGLHEFAAPTNLD